jgi:seryl-tRNA synthetase
MLEISNIRSRGEALLANLRKRGNADFTETFQRIITTDDQRKTAQFELDNLLGQSNKLAKEIGIMLGKGNSAQAEALKEQVAQNKERVKELERILADCEQTIRTELYKVPNAPHNDVVFGYGPDDNYIYKAWEQPLPSLYDGAVPHWDLAKKYDLIDFELGVKITGAGFPVYKGKGAKLQRALIAFFLDEAEKAGYTEFMPPHMVNEASGYGTGQLPDKEGQMYYVTADDLYLIPTAEVPLTNLYRDVILNEKDFPVKLVGYTPCFRREAGSYGKDVRGLNRLHQFDKVEIVQLEHPDNSYNTLHQMLTHVAHLLYKLELPYRILRLCGGDMGFNSAMTYDFEVYSAAQQRWLEVSSVSNFETYQANRLKLRFKASDGKMRLAHTLNGSALALARIVASMLENHQTERGIRIPQALVPYTRFEWIE